METNSEPKVPPPPPKARFVRLRLYLGIFNTMLAKTLAVGVGLSLIALIVGVVTTKSQEAQCNVSVRTLHGILDTYTLGTVDETDSGSLVSALSRDEKDDNIRAVILDVDSPGGYPVAGEEVDAALSRLTKPNVAVIRSTGASAAYWATLGAGRIFASKNSDVGSIGVLVSFPDESEKNKKDGVVYNEFTSGKYKNLGTPTRPITNDEKALVERDINEVYENFVAAVMDARQLTSEKAHALADGSSMTGARAKEAGLIDEIGGVEEARAYLEKTIGAPAVLCEPDAVPLF